MLKGLKSKFLGHRAPHNLNYISAILRNSNNNNKSSPKIKHL